MKKPSAEKPGGFLRECFVLDLSRVLAGPYCTMQLADLGAQVVKVEHPDGGDETRHWGPPFDAALKVSAYFAAVNRNKKSVAVDFRKPAGRDIVFQLAARADVVVENFKAGGLARHGLDYDSVRAANPEIVYCSLTGYGQTGPWRRRAGYDFIIQGESGLMAVGGETDGAAMKTGVAICDVLAGLNASQAILAALLRRAHGGGGAHIDISLFDCAIAAMVNVAQAAVSSGQPSRRHGNHHPHIVPYGVFTASDGDFNLAVGNDRQFADLCRMLRKPEWREHYATNPMRIASRDTLIARLNARFVQKPARHWIAACRRRDIPAGTVLNIAAALRLPQTRRRQMLESPPNVPAAVLLNTPLKFLGADKPPPRRPPPLGADTARVLTEKLRCSAADIRRWRAQKIIA